MAPSPRTSAGKRPAAAPSLMATDRERHLAARPDSLDFRDRMYVPTLVEVPPQKSIDAFRSLGLPILDQGSEGACTGFALAAVAHFLLATRADGGDTVPVSPHMLYALARRYDEWAGEDYEGSSCRGAMKGWHKHGVCSLSAWSRPSRRRRGLDEAVVNDAAGRPLGAYFRVNHTDFVSLHAAITEVGVLYASARVHAGWQDVGSDGRIAPGGEILGGHAFAIVAYDHDGFWIQNSWGPTWGAGGFGHLSYADWLANGSDTWVARLGVPVLMPEDAGGNAEVGTVRSRAYQYNRIRPHVVSLRNDGQLDPHGNLGTTADTLSEILRGDFPRLTSGWKKRRLILYAHGGLVAEEAALQRVAEYREEMLPLQCYPLAFIWKSDYWSTLRNMLEDATRHRRSEGFLDSAKDFMLDRLDDALEPLARHLTGKAQWDEMKENALRATTTARGGARLLAGHLAALATELPDLEIHLVGHSAGSIFLAPLLRHLTDDLGLPVASCTLWAPACTTRLFQDHYLSALENERLGELTLYTLTDEAEQNDDCARIYNKSLLYLVSHAFEERIRIPLTGPHGEPILGMEKWIRSDAALANLFAGGNPQVHWIRSPNDAPIDSPEAARAAHHGDFDSPRYRVLASTLARICRDRKVSVGPTRFARTAPSRRELRQRLDALTGPRPR